MPKTLTDAEVGRYEETGVLFPISVMTSDKAAGYRAYCDDLEERLGGKTSGC